MTDEQKQKRRDYQKEYYKNIMQKKKSYKRTIKEYNRSNLLLNKTRQIVYFNYFVSVFLVLLSNK